MAILFFVSCSKQRENELIQKKVIEDTLGKYLVLDTADISIRQNLWYSLHLLQMNEPNLKSQILDPANEIYRLLVLPSFGQPYCVKIVIDKQIKKDPFLISPTLDTFCLVGITYTVTYGAGGYGGGPIESSLFVNLPSEDSITKRNLSVLDLSLRNYNFW